MSNITKSERLSV